MGKNNKYYYENKTLVEYCKSKNINYKTILSLIRALKKKKQYQNFNNDQLVETALKKIGTTKYMYKGVTLLSFCRQNNLNYVNLSKRIYTMKKKDKYSDYSYDKLVEMVVTSELDKKHNISFQELCDKYNLKYKTIYQRIERLSKEEKYKNYSRKELIQLAINSKRKSKYMVEGETLHNYCATNNLPYDTILNRITQLKKKKAYKEMSVEQIIQLAIERSPTEKYYNGIPLDKYCEENDIDIKYVLRKLGMYKKEEKYEYSTNDEIIKDIIDNISDKTIYYNGIKLKDYCDRIDISYSYVAQRIKTLKQRKEYYQYNDNELIDFIVKQYNENKTKKAMFDILNNDIKNDFKLKEICNYFNVNYDNVKRLSSKMDVKKAFNIIYYFGDLKDEIGNKYISLERIEEIKKLPNKIKENNADELSIVELVGLYKIGLYDTRVHIINKRIRHIHNDIFKLCKKLNVKLNSDNKKEFMSEMQYIYLDTIDEINSDIDAKIWMYITKTVRGKFITYLKKYKTILSKEKTILNSTAGKDGMQLIEEIPSSKTGFEKLFDGDNDRNIMNLLKDLNPAEKKYILLRFKENYNCEEIAKMYGVSIDKVTKKEKSILNKLKENETIKRKVKKIGG